MLLVLCTMNSRQVSPGEEFEVFSPPVTPPKREESGVLVGGTMTHLASRLSQTVIPFGSLP